MSPSAPPTVPGNGTRRGGAATGAPPARCRAAARGDRHAGDREHCAEGQRDPPPSPPTLVPESARGAPTPQLVLEATPRLGEPRVVHAEGQTRSTVEHLVDDRLCGAIVALAGRHGYEFTEGELKDYLTAEAQGGDSSPADLSDEELEAIAGGFKITWSRVVSVQDSSIGNLYGDVSRFILF